MAKSLQMLLFGARGLALAEIKWYNLQIMSEQEHIQAPPADALLERPQQKAFISQYTDLMGRVRDENGNLRAGEVATLTDSETGVEVRIRHEERALRFGRRVLRALRGGGAPFLHAPVEIFTPDSDEPIELTVFGSKYTGMKAQAAQSGQPLPAEKALELFHSVTPKAAKARVERVEDLAAQYSFTGEDKKAVTALLGPLLQGPEQLARGVTYNNAPQMMLGGDVPLVSIRRSGFGETSGRDDGTITIASAVTGLPIREIHFVYSMEGKHRTGTYFRFSDPFSEKAASELPPMEREQMGAILKETLQRQHLAEDMDEEAGKMPDSRAHQAAVKLAHTGNTSRLDPETGALYAHAQMKDEKSGDTVHVYTWTDPVRKSKNELTFAVSEDLGLTVIASLPEGLASVQMPLDPEQAKNAMNCNTTVFYSAKEGHEGELQLYAAVYEQIRRLAEATELE